MIISRLELRNFRSYEKKDFEFFQKNLITGRNGAGKTNIIEALYMMATGKSFRAETDFELIKYENNLAIIQCQIPNQNVLKIIITGRKSFEVNGVPRRMVDFAGRVRAVKFGPEDMEIITGSPSGRRRYLDFVISQKDREYRRCLISYEKGLRQRNKLLDLIRDGLAVRTQLYFWDKLLIKDGEYITKKRGEYLEGFGEAIYDKSIISEMRLKQYEAEEVAAGTTLVGPHRDDFAVLSLGHDVSKYGSRGEQRMALLRLKIWERNYLTGDLSELPIMLLDDIFSELDHNHRKEVLKLIDEHEARGGQVIMTTADEHLIPTAKSWNIIKL